MDRPRNSSSEKQHYGNKGGIFVASLVQVSCSNQNLYRYLGEKINSSSVELSTF